MPSRRLAEHVQRGVLFNACSLHQLEAYGKVAPGAERLRPASTRASAAAAPTAPTPAARPPASGSGTSTCRRSSGSPQQYDLTIDRIHSHIGSGSDPEVYKRVTRMTLDLVEQFPDVQRGQPGRRLQGGPHAERDRRPTCKISGTMSSAS